MGDVMQPLADQPAHSSGQSPPVSGRLRRPGGSSLPRCHETMFWIIDIIFIYNIINYYNEYAWYIVSGCSPNAQKRRWFPDRSHEPRIGRKLVHLGCLGAEKSVGSWYDVS